MKRKYDDIVEETGKLEYPEVTVNKSAIDAIIAEVNITKDILTDLRKLLRYRKPPLKTNHMTDLRDELNVILRQLKKLRKGI